jgi:hypothetical protein
VLKSDLEKRWRTTPGYVGKRKMAVLDGKLEYGRRKGVMTKSQLKKRLLEDLKHEV